MNNEKPTQVFVFFKHFDGTLCLKSIANNRAQEFWAFSAPAPEPNFDPAGMTAPAPSPMHNFLK